MDRTQAKALLPILAAYAEGKDVQKRDKDGNWSTVMNPQFAVDPDRYRIKPDTFNVYCNVYNHSTGTCVLERDNLITNNRQGYLTVTWEDGQFKSVEFTKV